MKDVDKEILRYRITERHRMLMRFEDALLGMIIAVSFGALGAIAMLRLIVHFKTVALGS